MKSLLPAVASSLRRWTGTSRIRTAMLVAVGVAAVGSAWAVPADTSPRTFYQPDGTAFTGRIRGDEFFHWVETADGHPIVQDEARTWRFAKKAAEGVGGATDQVAGRDPAPADPWKPMTPAAAKTKAANRVLTPLAPPDKVARDGVVDIKVPVLLGTFSDRTGGINAPLGTTAQWEFTLFNQDTAAADSRSVRELYHEMSGGKARVTSGPGGISGWHVAPHDHNWYGGSQGGIENEQGYYFVRDIVEKADPTFNFGPYDTDNDGYVDLLAVIYQGTGEATSGVPTDIWPHQSELADQGTWPFRGAYETNDLNALGQRVKINKYFMQNEEEYNANPLAPAQMAAIGTFCHELGHALGLPDLYDRDTGDINRGLGQWSLMSGGNYCTLSRSGDCPCWMDPWCRAKVGWVVPEVVTQNSVGYVLEAAELNGKVLKIPISLPNEYFLVETRVKQGFDRALPGEGVLIWHVDENAPNNNSPWWLPNNTTNGHMKVALEQADGRNDIESNGSAGDATDPFQTAADLFDSTTDPSSNAYNRPGTSGDGRPTNVALKNFARVDDARWKFDLFIHPDVTPPDLTILTPSEGPAGLNLSHCSFTTTDSYVAVTVTVRIRSLDVPATIQRWWNAALGAWEITDFPSSNVATFRGGLGEYRLDIDPAAFGRGHFRLEARIEDIWGNRTEQVREFVLSDTTPPGVDLTSPLADTENLPPVTISGTASDDDAVALKRVALFNQDQGKWYKWSAPAGFTGATFSFADHALPLNGPASPWSTVLPAGLPFGHYFVTVQSVDGAGNASAWKGVSFLLGASPTVTIEEPANNALSRGFPTLRGHTTDPGGTGILGNLVQVTIYQDGEYWNGSAWQNTPAAVSAAIQAGGAWEYTGTRPTRDGVMIVSAAVEDNVGNKAKRIGPGLPGANSVNFVADATPPEVHIGSPALGDGGTPGVVTAPPLPAGWIAGTARDASGRPTVALTLQRLADGMFWNGVAWVPSSTPLVGSFNGGGGGDGGSQVAWTLANRLPALGTGYGCMTNGTYRISVTATDAAGNTGTDERDATIDWHPVWLSAADQATDVLPTLENTPLHPDTVTATVLGTYPVAYQPFGSPSVAVGVDPAGSPVTAAKVTHASPWLSALKPDGEFRRLGPAPWVRDGQGGTDFTGFATAVVDSAGNTFAAYTTAVPTGIGLAPSSKTTVYLKLSADGSLAWRTPVGTGESESQTFVGAGPYLVQPQADGSLIAVEKVGSGYLMPPGTGSFYSTRMIHFSAGGSILRQWEFFAPNDGVRPGTSIVPRFLTVAGGSAFLGTEETDVGSYSVRQVVRRVDLATGAVVRSLEIDRCEVPETWLALTADAAGNLFQLSAFNAAADDVRLCVTRFDSNLNRVWRSFGPPRSAFDAGGVWVTSWMSAGLLFLGPEGLTAVSHMPPAPFGTVTEHPNGGPIFCRFNLDGDLVWSRVVSSGKSGGFIGMTDALVAAHVDATGAALFLANFIEDASAVTQRGIYGKISSLGDVQFLKSLGVGGLIDPATTLDSQGRLLSLAYLPDSASMSVTRYDNPGSVQVPVLLDAGSPADRTVLPGENVTLTVVNRGSPASYQWRREDGAGTPQPIEGATGQTLVLNNIGAASGGRYSCLVTNGLGTRTSRTATVTVLTPVSLAEALDTPGQPWTTGGDRPWEGLSPAPSHDGIDATRSGEIGEFEQSWIETVIVGPATISWWEKNDSTQYFDPLEMTDNGDPISSLPGGSDWRQATYDVPAGSHTLRWTYRATVAGARAGLDQFVLPAAVGLAEALDMPAATFTTGGNAPWTGINTPSHDGVDAAASGTIGHNASSFVALTVAGPGTLSFWWKLSASFTDTLEFRVDGGRRAYVTGESDWNQVTGMPIDPGSHVLRWEYVKDDFLVGGLDRAWLDEVVFIPSGPATQSFSQWLASGSGFTAGELANPAVSGPGADPDGDGLANLLEFAQGLSPKSPSSVDRPTAVLTAPGTVIFTYWRSRTAGGVQYIVEHSQGGSAWSSNGVDAHVLVETTASRERWSAVVHGPVSSDMIRLRVSAAP